LGVAGWSLSDGRHTLLVDPYFSRAQDPANARPDEAAVVARTPPTADLVLVGHDHWDHALDAPLVARRTARSGWCGSSGTRGSRSTGSSVSAAARSSSSRATRYGSFRACTPSSG